MNRNISFTILTVALVIFAIFLFRNTRANKLRKQKSIETATGFFPIKDIDSIYSRNDTVLFFKNDSFLGKIVTVYAPEDTVRFYRNDSLVGMMVTVTEFSFF